MTCGWQLKNDHHHFSFSLIWLRHLTMWTITFSWSASITSLDCQTVHWNGSSGTSQTGPNTCMSHWEDASPGCSLSPVVLHRGQSLAQSSSSFTWFLSVVSSADIGSLSTVMLNASEALSSLTTCLEEIKTWKNSNFPQLNSSKTEALVNGTPHQAQSSSIIQLSFWWPSLSTPQPQTWEFGLTLIWLHSTTSAKLQPCQMLRS